MGKKETIRKEEETIMLGKEGRTSEWWNKFV